MTMMMMMTTTTRQNNIGIVKLAKTGHGPHYSQLVVICVLLLLFVFSALFVSLYVLLCVNTIAVDKYIVSFIIMLLPRVSHVFRFGSNTKWVVYRVRRAGCWLPTPHAHFPFFSLSVRNLMPLHSNLTLPHAFFKSKTATRDCRVRKQLSIWYCGITRSTVELKWRKPYQAIDDIQCNQNSGNVVIYPMIQHFTNN